MTNKSPSIHRTPLYRAKAAYSNMKARCGNANGKNPAYADVELRMPLDGWIAWAVPEYEKFDKEHPGRRPSVSRFGDKGHYELGNIEIVPREVNRLLQKIRNKMRDDGKKHCCRCGMVKNYSEFWRDLKNVDGHGDWCKECSKAYRKQRRSGS